MLTKNLSYSEIQKKEIGERCMVVVGKMYVNQELKLWKIEIGVLEGGGGGWGVRGSGCESKIEVIVKLKKIKVGGCGCEPKIGIIVKIKIDNNNNNGVINFWFKILLNRWMAGQTDTNIQNLNYNMH